MGEHFETLTVLLACGTFKCYLSTPGRGAFKLMRLICPNKLPAVFKRGTCRLDIDVCVVVQ